MPDSTLEWIAAALVGIIGAARLVRLVVFDDFPPVMWLRIKYLDRTHHTPWSKLVTCGFCLAPWVVAGEMAWAYFTDMHWSWWLFNGWLAAAYLAAIVVSYDQPE